MKEELLEYVYEISEESYLSNIRVPVVLERLLPKIKAIDENDFSLKQWNAFLSYIIGGLPSCTTIQEAKVLLEKFIEK